jgi:hypothetical protein
MNSTISFSPFAKWMQHYIYIAKIKMNEIEENLKQRGLKGGDEGKDYVRTPEHIKIKHSIEEGRELSIALPTDCCKACLREEVMGDHGDMIETLEDMSDFPDRFDSLNEASDHIMNWRQSEKPRGWMEDEE